MNASSRLKLFLAVAFTLLPLRAHAEITVSAASSLANVMKDIIGEYQAQNPTRQVHLNLGPTGALIQQVRNGAPVDAVVLASTADMDGAEREGLIQSQTRRNVAGNRMVLVVPHGVAAEIRQLSDLTSSKVQRIGIGNPATAPAGRYARQALEALGLWGRLAEKLIVGETVRQILDYTIRGEVDAAFVFETDAHFASGQVETVTVLDGHAPVRYPAAVTASSGNPDAASRFVEFMSGETARRLFQKYRFAISGGGDGD
jgi:molybdate transport system substrate-binding protein